MRRSALFLVLFCPSLAFVAPGKHFRGKHVHAARHSPVNSNDYIYDSLNLSQFGLSKKVFMLALEGWQRLSLAGRVVNKSVISIIDFSQPSNKKRLYIIDLLNARLLFNTYVAHGRRSGKEMATRFSNRPRSLESSVGFYVTADTYMGSNGYSLKLAGQEKGFNDNAARREIVLHGADYVSEEYIASNGYLGRSWGCPAVPLDESRDIIDSIKNGSCLFIYSPQERYLHGSRVLNGRS